MLSIKETAKTLRISEATVRRFIASGEIRAVKVGEQWRIIEAEIERIKNEGTGRKSDELVGKGKETSR